MLALLRHAIGARSLSIVLVLGWAVTAGASDWTRFRGENGSGVSADSSPLPAEWSDAKNLKWSVDLPGNGHSCPIVVGDKVIVTCWTGADAPEMVRHLMCFDRATGKQLWDTPVDPVVQDEPYRGMFAQHGYASHTPVSDGERIYCFFGVSGVYAFDMDGKQLWGPVSVGTDFDDRGWGSASSPVLYKDKVIITAGSESRTMFALDKNDGHEVWKQPAGALAGLWGTPVLLEAEGQTDLVLGVPGELWGVNPDTGKLRWYVVAGRGDSMCGSAIVHDGVAYVLGERGGQMVAVKGGGKGDVTGSHVLWAKNFQGRISTPVAADGLIYVPAGGSLLCVDAATGDEVYNERLEAPPTSEAAPNAESTAQAEGENRGDRGGGFGGFGGRRGGRGGRGGFMSSDYSSPVLADGKVIFVRRQGAMHVVKTGREFEQLAVNKFEGEADYSASPAVSDGDLFIRSSKKLYCVAKTE
jgi:outer membrane protein assembly factor BamB